jgi:hypothetical protein
MGCGSSRAAKTKEDEKKHQEQTVTKNVEIIAEICSS